MELGSRGTREADGALTCAEEGKSRQGPRGVDWTSTPVLDSLGGGRSQGSLSPHKLRKITSSASRQTLPYRAVEGLFLRGLCDGETIACGPDSLLKTSLSSSGLYYDLFRF